MPRRFSPEVRGILYDFLKQRDGPRCFNCQRSEGEVELVICHRDGNPKNNARENLQLGCRRCNLLDILTVRRTPPSPPPSDLSVEEREKEAVRNSNALKVEDEPPEMRTNREKEPLVRAWILQRVIRGPEIQLWEAVDGAAEKYELSQVTVRRYVRKMLSPQGPLRLSPGRRGYQYLWLKEGALGLAADSVKGKIPEEKSR